MIRHDRVVDHVLGLGLDAIRLAETDWRDALMAAGFGEDLQAHIAWARSIATS